MIKKGNQQIINAPVTIASVFAAFFSLFSSNEICFFFSFSFFGFRFSFGVVNRALSSVWHPVLECLIGPFLQSVFRWLPGLCHTINNHWIIFSILSRLTCAWDKYILLTPLGFVMMACLDFPWIYVTQFNFIKRQTKEKLSTLTYKGLLTQCKNSI